MLIYKKSENPAAKRGIKHGWFLLDLTSRISFQHQFRSWRSDYRLTATTSYYHRWWQIQYRNKLKILNLIHVVNEVEYLSMDLI